MKVMIAFYSGDRNPYLRLLIDSLKDAGLTVMIAEPRTVMPLLRAVARFGKPELVHLQWPIYFTSDRTYLHAIVHTIQFFVQILLLRLFGVRFVWTIHNIVNHQQYQLAWERSACRILARVVDALIVHCDSAVALVAEAYGVTHAKLHVVPHGNYTTWYPKAISKSAARADMGLPQDGRIYLYFGRIRRYKGIQRLVEAFHGVTTPEARLMLVGKTFSPETRNWLAEIQQDDPRIEAELSFVEDDLLVRYICASDVIVLPYENALTSGAAILACSLGRPVIAAAVGCMQDLPRNASIFFSPGNTESLVSALNQAGNADLSQMGAAAYAYASLFSWQKIAELNLAIYHRVLKKNPMGAYE